MNNDNDPRKIDFNLTQLIFDEMVQAERRGLSSHHKKAFVIEVILDILRLEYSQEEAGEFRPQIEETIEFIILLSKSDVLKSINKRVRRFCCGS